MIGLSSQDLMLLATFCSAKVSNKCVSSYISKTYVDFHVDFDFSYVDFVDFDN